MSVQHKPQIQLAISPCPNDTFIFEGLLHQLAQEFPLQLDVQFADVQTCNEWVLSGRVQLAKVSCGLLPHLGEEWIVLDCGGALGRGCGPLLLSTQEQWNPHAKTLLPGLHTTAARLFVYWQRAQGVASIPLLAHSSYDVLYRDLCAGRAQQGVVIHEMRFTYAADGLHLLVDLGQFWEEQTGAPIPLGAIVCHKSIADWIPIIEGGIRTSLQQAWSRSEPVTPFIRAHAQSLSDAVIAQHIATFVTPYSMNMGDEGRRALELLSLRT